AVGFCCRPEEAFLVLNERQLPTAPSLGCFLDWFVITMNLDQVQEAGVRGLHRKQEHMIHFTCDYCQQTIDPERELRYVVRMEVYAALDVSDADAESDRDHLEEIEDILERLADETDP